MTRTNYMFSEAKAKDLAPKAKAKAKDMTSCPRGASRPRPRPRGLHLWCYTRRIIQDELFIFAFSFRILYVDIVNLHFRSFALLYIPEYNRSHVLSIICCFLKHEILPAFIEDHILWDSSSKKNSDSQHRQSEMGVVSCILISFAKNRIDIL